MILYYKKYIFDRESVSVYTEGMLWSANTTIVVNMLMISPLCVVKRAEGAIVESIVSSVRSLLQ